MFDDDGNFLGFLLCGILFVLVIAGCAWWFDSHQSSLLREGISTYSHEPTEQNWKKLEPKLTQEALGKVSENNEESLITDTLIPVLLAKGRLTDADKIITLMEYNQVDKPWTSQVLTTYSEKIGKNLLDINELPPQLMLEKAAWMKQHSTLNDTYKTLAPEAIKPMSHHLVGYVSTILNRMGCRYEANLWAMAFKKPVPEIAVTPLPDIDPTPYQSHLVEDVAKLSKGTLPPLTQVCAQRLAQF